MTPPSSRTRTALVFSRKKIRPSGVEDGDDADGPTTANDSKVTQRDPDGLLPHQAPGVTAGAGSGAAASLSARSAPATTTCTGDDRALSTKLATVVRWRV
jgi:hypothetical protein